MCNKKSFHRGIVQELIKMAREQTAGQNYKRRRGGRRRREGGKKGCGSLWNPGGDISLGGRSHGTLLQFAPGPDKMLQRLQPLAHLLRMHEHKHNAEEHG